MGPRPPPNGTEALNASTVATVNRARNSSVSTSTIANTRRRTLS